MSKLTHKIVEVPAGSKVADFPTGYASKSELFLHIAARCDHDFKGWREFEDGNGGEQVCTKCGIGAMAYSLATGF